MRKLLSLIQQRSTQSSKPDLINGKASDREKLRAIERSIDHGGKDKHAREEVVLKATNRAIEKALELGLYFQGQGDVDVRLRTGTVGAVDDIEEGKGPRKGMKGKGKRKVPGKEAEKVEEEELPETQIRKVSVLEVAITLK